MHLLLKQSVSNLIKLNPVIKINQFKFGLSLKPKIQFSNLSHKAVIKGNPIVWEDIEIGVKWGKLRGKRLINEDHNSATNRTKVLGLHGWLDNCNSFDVIAPYLPNNVDFISLDLPGHGWSDHVPISSRYDIITYTLSMKEAITNYGWESCVLLGHSMGGSLGHFLANTFPDIVEGLISVDFFGNFGLKPAVSTSIIKEMQNQFKAENLTRSPPEYSREEVLERIIKSRLFNSKNIPSVDEVSAKILFDRTAKRIDGKQGPSYTWRYDPRAKVQFHAFFNDDFMNQLAKDITCPTLLIKADKGVYLEKQLDHQFVQDVYSANTKFCKFVEISGLHHVHMTNAQDTAIHVNEFLNMIVNAKLVK